MLAWTKRVEAQRAQVAVLNTLIECRQFEKIKLSKRVKESRTKTLMYQSSTQWQPCRYCGGIHPPRQCPAYGKTCMECIKIRHFHKVCQSGKNRVINENEQEVSQEYTEDDLEMVSINLVCLTKTVQC